MKKKQSQKRNKEEWVIIPTVLEIWQIYVKSMKLWQNLPWVVYLTSPSKYLLRQKKKKVKWEKSSEKKLLKKSYIHHHIYEELKFYLIGQDSD